MAFQLEKREEYRSTIKQLTYLQGIFEDFLKDKKPIPKPVSVFVSQLARTDDPINQLEFLSAFLERKQEEYSYFLQSHAYEHLSVFYEFLRPDEPPAKHHEFICDRLEAIEIGRASCRERV